MLCRSFPDLLKAANERLVLTATRNFFDEFNEPRAMRKQREALNQSGEHNLSTEASDELLDEQTDFTQHPK